MSTSTLQLDCPHCHTTNRIPEARVNDGPRCGACKAPILSGAPLSLTQANFMPLARSLDKPLLVDFWAPWCAPCRSFAPTYSQVAQQRNDVVFAKVDTEAESFLGQQFGIRSIPTLALFKRGQELARISGALPASELGRWIDTASNS
ncbi:thioredoxin TrxC [Chitinimonas lacunae]|uniref:Thioredoxin n=1 Tax=Chitinimonas lacunae TaxID=1963018 RepID=A0ABV8MM94_9NEIS